MAVEWGQSPSLQDLHIICVRCVWEYSDFLIIFLFPLHFYFAILCCCCLYCSDMAQSLLLSLSLFYRTRAQRTGRVQMSVSPQFFTLVLSPACLGLPTLDSFEPFRGAVSGSSGFYTFTEFLQFREFSWHQAVQQCALSMHLTAYCCLVTNCFLVWKMQWFLPVLNLFYLSSAEPSASSEPESFQTWSSYWHLTSQ